MNEELKTKILKLSYDLAYDATDMSYLVAVLGKGAEQCLNFSTYELMYKAVQELSGALMLVSRFLDGVAYRSWDLQELLENHIESCGDHVV